MKVFVITLSPRYEFDRIVGICLSKEDAEEMIDKIMNKDDDSWIKKNELIISEQEIGKGICLY